MKFEPENPCHEVVRTDPVRVLLFTPAPSLGGGVAEFADVLRRRLDSSVDLEMFVIGRRPGPWGRAFRTFVPLFDAVRLALLLLSTRHDVYHLNPSLVPRAVFRDGMFLLVLRLFGRSGVLVFFRGWDSSFFNRVTNSWLGRNAFAYMFGRASHILVLASRFAVDLSRVGIPIDRVSTFTTMFDGDELRVPRSRADDGEVRFLFMARFIAEKGIYELLEAFRRIAVGSGNVRLVLAGDGDEMANARDWCERNGLSDRVQFPGYVRGESKARLLIDSDVFVLPTYHDEGCPNALLEAMGAGLPVIVCPSGGIPDIVTHNESGLVVPPRDVDALESAMRLLVQNPGLRAEFSSCNHKQAWDRYEGAIVSGALVAHYRRIAESRANRITVPSRRP